MPRGDLVEDEDRQEEEEEESADHPEAEEV